MQNRNVKVLFVPPGWSAILLVVCFLVFALSGHFRREPPSSPAIYLGLPLNGVTVAIDPAHGGIDPGSHYNNMLTEKEVVLAMGLHLHDLLEQSGATIIMTRESDQDTSEHYPHQSLNRYQRDIRGRIKIINESEADFFISLHIDSCVDANVRGAITFYNDRFPENEILAKIIQKNVNPIVRKDPEPEQYFHQKVKEGSFFILNDTIIPGVLLEAAFITSPADRELLQQEEHRKELARALFMGIVEYVYTDQNRSLNE